MSCSAGFPKQRMRAAQSSARLCIARQGVIGSYPIGGLTSQSQSAQFGVEPCA